jgi:hypothetical protein
MAILAEDKGGDFKPKPLIEAGTHLATCFYMVHIGTIEVTYKGETKNANKVRIGFELPSLMQTFDAAKGEQPMAIYKEFNLSMNEKSTLRKFLESWRGAAFSEKESKSFDITRLLGKSCLLSIINEQLTNDPTKSYNKISSIMPVMKNMEIPKLINSIVHVDYDNLTDEIFDGLPQFLRDKMETSLEYLAFKRKQKQIVSQVSQTEIEENLPF